MANSSRPGLRPVRARSGVTNGRLMWFEFADRSADTTNNHGHAFLNDPVSFSSGKLIPMNSNATCLGVVVAIGKKPAGVMGEGIPAFDMDTPSSQYAPLATTSGIYGLVALAKDWVFEGETVAAGTYVAGDNVDIDTDANEAHGSITTNHSTCRLKANVNTDCLVVAGNTNNDIQNNDPTLIYGKYQVVFTDIVNM